MGLYKVDKVFDNGIISLTTIDENHTPLFANGHRLRFYYKPTSKHVFISHIAADPNYQFVQE